ncbi:ATP-binding protein [Streptomyces sp. A1277]|uniref:ATP-binding protein n=1 Tax=Streptomyces sp. A1277 TaxID=2563103 RepID=UPI0010A21A99|nr:ATP-binding protein [Streptomyces sp. A1277]THA29323.1 ATP-binding protein [Streptomyces sp. A1277]
MADLWERLGRIERRVRLAVAVRRDADPEPDDPFRGQYLTAAAAERVLDSRDAFRPVPGPDTPADSPERGRIAALVERFGLVAPDVDLLLVAMAPDIDARFERLYGYLNDDLTRRRATIGLALELCGLPAAGAGRFRFGPSAPLVAAGLVEVLEPERPLLSRVLRVPDRITAHLLGDDEVDGRLHGLVRVGEPPEGPGACPTTLRIAAAAGTGLVHLLDRGGDPGGLAADALASAGLRPLVVDAAALAAAPAPDRTVRVLAAEARLSGGGLVLGPLETLAPEQPEGAALVGALCAAVGGGSPLIVYGKKNWDPLWAGESPVTVTVPPPDPADAARRWRHALTGAGAGAGAGTDAGAGLAAGTATADADLADATRAYRLDSGQIRRAAAVASRLAALEGRPVEARDLRTAVRAQNGAGLARLARRIEPAVGWDDLVLPPATRRQLSDLALRARHREQVLGQWRMRPGGGRGRGIVALFAGESGTGKTMSAEVVAADLGMELYVVDLSSVVDKYVGETEKNLERIFAEASDVNAVLLFDEADAVFGKRSQVKDAQDRHANVESAYLLQRVESFDGIAVLTTNLRANLDEAFTRRLDVVADFPVPDAQQRLALWERCLGTEVPRAPGLDLPTCAERFELTGGSIRACAVTAAYQAAESGRPLDTEQLVAAVLAEYRKLGRLVLDSEFGPWLERARPRPAGRA